MKTVCHPGIFTTDTPKPGESALVAHLTTHSNKNATTLIAQRHMNAHHMAVSEFPLRVLPLQAVLPPFHALPILTARTLRSLLWNLSLGLSCPYYEIGISWGRGSTHNVYLPQKGRLQLAKIMITQMSRLLNHWLFYWSCSQNWGERVTYKKQE